MLQFQRNATSPILNTAGPKRWAHKRAPSRLAAVALCSMFVMVPGMVRAEPPPLPELDLNGILADKPYALKVATLLGKAMFWDIQVGSDGMACASCHFQAGADGRVRNQLSPGFENIPSDTSFGATVADAAYYDRQFLDGRATELFNGRGFGGEREIQSDPTARLIVGYGHSAGLEALRLRNASLASQAVAPLTSNFEMSCDGRTIPDVGRKLLSRKRRPLQHQKIHKYDSAFGFHGPFGDLRHYSGRGLDSRLTYEQLIKFAFDKKYWGANGHFVITPSGKLQKSGYGYTQMEHNFALFWGVAVMLYERTLLSFDSYFDRCNPDDDGECQNPGAEPLSAEEKAGFLAFGSFGGPDSARCTACHGGIFFTDAAADGAADFEKVERVGMPDGEIAIQDLGFLPVGLRPAREDLLVGGVDSWNVPKSYTRQLLGVPLDPDLPSLDDVLCGPAGPFAPPPHPDCVAGSYTGSLADVRVAVDGAPKNPTLRNVALNPSYFGYGGYSNLKEVLHSYSRGGSVRLHGGGLSGDNSGTGPKGQDVIVPATGLVAGADQGSNLVTNIEPLDCDQTCQDNIVAFLKTLSDDDVRCDRAPFDHPELFIPHGHYAEDKNHDGLADDIINVLPAVGAGGYSEASGFCIPNAGDLFAPGMLGRVGAAH